MKRALLTLLIVSVASCGFFAAPVDPDGATLTTTEGAVRFSSGLSDALNVKLEVSAIGIRVNDTKCKLTGGTVLCDLGTVPAGRTYRLPISGTAITARVAYKRVSGAVFEVYSR